MRNRHVWRWGAPGAVLERPMDDEYGGSEVVWINARLPPAVARARYGLRVEILCWFDDGAALNAGLEVLHDYFHADSFLAAVRRRDNATKVLLYTAASEAFVDDRYLGFRAVIRPTVVGLRVALEPTWASLTELEDALNMRAARSELVAGAGAS